MYFLLIKIANSLTNFTCQHDSIQHNFTFEQTRPYPGRKNVNAKILLKYVPEWGYSDSDLTGIALKSGTQQIISFLQNVLQVTQQQIRTTATTCYDMPVPSADQNVYFDADLIIWARTLSSGSFYANAAYCVLRSTSPRRSLFGRIAWNSGLIDASYSQSTIGYQVNLRVMFHQIVHLLGFSSGLYTYYVPTTVNETVNGMNMVVLTSVKAEVEAYYGCTGTGMPLQNQGTSGSLGSHWQKDLLKDQLMTAQFSGQDYLFLSSLTLALLKDTGWYTSVDMTVNQNSFMLFGKGRGCSFINTRDCSITPQYCPTTGVAGLTFYMQAQGVCSTNTFSNCNYIGGYTNRNCRSSSYSGIYGNLATSLEQGGWNSSAYSASIVQIGYLAQAGYRCYKTYCNADGSSVIITIGSVNYTCTNGATVSDSARFVGSLTCPSNTVNFCKGRMSCQNHCGSQYVCHKGICYGKPGACTSNQYSNSGVCTSCHISCSTCVSGSSCTTCATGYNLVTNSLCIQCLGLGQSYSQMTQDCVCADGYFGTSPSCTQCNSVCATCTTASSCLTCATGYTPVLNSLCIQCTGLGVVYDAFLQNCACDIGYFGTYPTCTKCDVSCALCNSAAGCTTCAYGYNPQGSLLCIQCTRSGQTYSSTFQTCVCRDGYFGTPPSCASCHSSCMRCQSLTSCTACAIGYNPVTNSLCVRCAYPNSTYDSGTKKCLCNVGYYEQGASCPACKTGCSSCTLAGCKTCQFGYILNGTTCRLNLNCPSNNIIQNQTCVDCLTKFANKLTMTCVSCASNQIWNSTSNQCTVCPSLLASYQNSCQKCPSNLFFLNQTCVKECPSNYQNKNMTCSPCGSCTNRIIFKLKNITFIGQKIIVSISFSKTNFQKQIGTLPSSKVKITFTKKSTIRLLQQTFQVSPDEVVTTSEGISFGVNAPSWLSSGQFDISVAINDIPSLVSSDQSSLSNSQASQTFTIPDIKSAENLVYLGYVIGIVLIVASAVCKYLGFVYNVMQFSQSIYMMLFIYPNLSFFTISAVSGFSFANFNFYNPFLLLLNSTQTASSNSNFERLNLDSNVIRLGGGTLLSLAVIILLGSILSKVVVSKRSQTIKVFSNLVSGCMTLLLFLSLSQLSNVTKNRLNLTKGFYLSSIIASCVIIVLLLAIMIASRSISINSQFQTQREQQASIVQIKNNQMFNSHNQLDIPVSNVQRVSFFKECVLDYLIKIFLVTVLVLAQTYYWVLYLLILIAVINLFFIFIINRRQVLLGIVDIIISVLLSTIGNASVGWPLSIGAILMILVSVGLAIYQRKSKSFETL